MDGFLAHPYKASSGWLVICLFDRKYDARPWEKLLQENGIPVRVVERASLQIEPKYLDEARRLMKAECERLAMEPWPPIREAGDIDDQKEGEGEGNEKVQRGASPE